MGIAPNIKLYGSATCNKTAYYRKWLEDREWAYTFLDVIRSEQHAEELKNLYENRKLNFPTFTIDGKKL